MAEFKNYLEQEIELLQNATLAGISCIIFGNGFTQSGAESVLIPGIKMVEGRDNSLTLFCGPLIVGAGQEVAGVRFIPALNANINVELYVANTAGSQTLLTYTVGGYLPLIQDETKTMAASDWTTPSRIGTDLTINVNGKVVTTAGGVFWATAFLSANLP